MTSKRPRHDLDLKQKYEVVQLLMTGCKQKFIADKFHVNESTISRLKNNQNEIVSEFEFGKQNFNAMRHKHFQLEKVDAVLLEWFRTVSAGKAGVSGALLQEKAKEFAIKLKFQEEDVVKIDMNWINRFKSRHGIVAKKLHGEAARMSQKVVEDWRNNLLPAILRQFSLADIFNMDEMALFWKLLPDNTHHFKGETCSGGKRPKDRLTVLCGASAMGEKLPLLVIGKYLMPRCFRGENVPVTYVANKRSWMTGEIFTRYVVKRHVNGKLHCSSIFVQHIQQLRA